VLDINQIKELIPHRYPFLLIDRVIEISEESATAIKNVTANEPFFQGHFPDYPIMPGVLIAEAMAQTGAVLLMSNAGGSSDKLVLFANIENCRFKRPVYPGDQLRIEVEYLARKLTVAKMKGTASVDGKVVCQAVMMCQIADRPKDDPAGS